MCPFVTELQFKGDRVFLAILYSRIHQLFVFFWYSTTGTCICVCVIITFEVPLFFCLKEANGAFRESKLFVNILASFEQWIFYFKAKESRLIVNFHGNKENLYITISIVFVTQFVFCFSSATNKRSSFLYICYYSLFGT